MILFALLAMPLLQEPEPIETAEPLPSPTPEAEVDASKRRQWWGQLSKEERKEMRRRMDAMRKMPKESRESLEGRRQILEEEKQFVIEHLEPEELQAYEAMSDRERRHFLGPRVHQRMRQRGADLRQRFPGTGHDRKTFEEARRPQVMEGIQKAVADGWLGKRAGEWLQRAPLHQSMQVLMEVQKWQFLDRAGSRGYWEEHGVDEERQRRISERPAPEFFREIRELREGPRRRQEGMRDGRPGPGQRPKDGRRGQGPPPHGRPPGGGDDGERPPREGGRH
ncbi:MAG: hypothetical protein ACYSU1_04185 [Planctomycetota bacterium]|jgi:hypothetical protein